MELKKIIILVYILLLTILGCKDNPVNPNEKYSVSGKLICNGKSFAGATISLNERNNLTTQSNSEGSFNIKNIPKGHYTLSIDKTETDSSYVKKSFKITVTSDVFLDSNKVPKEVKLLIPQSVTSTSIDLRWNSTDAEDFKEYKLFKYTSPEFDSTKGELIYISTSAADTEFTDKNLNPNTAYNYRLYVMNDSSYIAGSNILSTQTSKIKINISGTVHVIQPEEYEDLQRIPIKLFIADKEYDITADNNGFFQTEINSKVDSARFVINLSDFTVLDTTIVNLNMSSDSVMVFSNLDFTINRIVNYFPVELSKAWTYNVNMAYSDVNGYISEGKEIWEIINIDSLENSFTIQCSFTGTFSNVLFGSPIDTTFYNGPVIGNYKFSINNEGYLTLLESHGGEPPFIGQMFFVINSISRKIVKVKRPYTENIGLYEYQNPPKPAYWIDRVVYQLEYNNGFKEIEVDNFIGNAYLLFRYNLEN